MRASIVVDTTRVGLATFAAGAATLTIAGVELVSGATARTVVLRALVFDAVFFFGVFTVFISFTGFGCLMLSLGSSHHTSSLWLHRFKSPEQKASDVPFRSGDFSVTYDKASPKL